MTFLVSTTRLALAGYDPAAQGTAIPMLTASQIVQVFQLPVHSLTAFGQRRTNFLVTAHDLPAGSSVDGVLGLDFLRGNVLTIDFPKGEITLAPPGAGP
jgi:hypothetical protein